VVYVVPAGVVTVSTFGMRVPSESFDGENSASGVIRVNMVFVCGVSTDGLHSYTCMLTSNHPPRLDKQ
jgi:hypothetical protein